MRDRRRFSMKERRHRRSAVGPGSHLHNVRHASQRATAGGNRKGYAGYEFDPGLSYTIWHVRYRAFCCELGRWTRRDPSGYADRVNQYEYVGSLPTIAVDPRGLARHFFGFDGFTSHLLRTEWGTNIIEAEGLGEFHGYSNHESAVARAVSEALVIAKTPVPTMTGIGLPMFVCTVQYHTIIVLGYSWGGPAAVEFVKRMRDENVAINLGFTADPIPQNGFLNPYQHSNEGPFADLTRPNNANRWVNWFQHVKIPEGREIDGADENRPLFPFDFGEGHPHILIVTHQRVTANTGFGLRAEIGRVPRLRSDWRFQ